MSIKSSILFTAILVVLLTTGFGCRGLSEDEQAAIQPVLLNYWTVYNDLPTLQKFAQEYKAIRPYVTINIRQVRSGEFNTLFLNALADDVAPDIISIHTRWLRAYQSRLSLMPKTVEVASVTVKGTYQPETIVTKETFEMQGVSGVKKYFLPTVADDVIIGSNVYGLPLALDTMVLYYNKDLLDKSGIPEPPKTWGDFLTAVKQTTKFNKQGDIIQSGTALGTGVNIDHAPDVMALLLKQNGVSVTDKGAVTFSAGVNANNAEHPTIQALRFYTDFSRFTKEAYSWNAKMENAFDAFTRGKVVFYFGFAFDYLRIKAKAPQMNIDILPVPQLNEAEPVNVANYWMESVVKKSKNQNEAWDFIRFITTQEKIKAYTDTTKQPSPLRAHVEEQKKDEFFAPFVAGILNADNWYGGRNVTVAEEALRDMAEKLVEPYVENKDPLSRDITIIQQAASVIQQTM